VNAEAEIAKLTFRGDACQADTNQNDLKECVAEVVSRIPDDVQDWLLYETEHAFIGGSGQLGEYFELFYRPHEQEHGLTKARIIFLSEQLMKMSREQALFTIAHEIAHSRLNHNKGSSSQAERDADTLAAVWGFLPPPNVKSPR
jgi:Zn-dependent protease with chaperone function